MDKIMATLTWMTENYKKVVLIMILMLTAIVGILNFIPGDQGESKIQAVIDTLKKVEPQE